MQTKLNGWAWILKAQGDCQGQMASGFGGRYMGGPWEPSLCQLLLLPPRSVNMKAQWIVPCPNKCPSPCKKQSLSGFLSSLLGCTHSAPNLGWFCLCWGLLFQCRTYTDSFVNVLTPDVCVLLSFGFFKVDTYPQICDVLLYHSPCTTFEKFMLTCCEWIVTCGGRLRNNDENFVWKLPKNSI